MSLRVWTIFLLTETSLCLSPGPAVIFVLSQGLSRGALASIWSSVGILTGNAMYFILSATSLAALLLTSGTAFAVLTWIGAAYMVWLGVQTFSARRSAIAAPARDSRASSGARMFANGFVLQASNPGALVFFAAVLPQFISQKASVTTQVAVLGVTSIVVEFIVLTAYGVLAGRLARLATRPAFATFVNRLAGTMLLIAALALMVRRLRT